jgi:hypothetical protein
MRKPMERNSFWKSRIWPTEASLGPLSAMMTDPRMESTQPSQPKNVSVSLRNIEERMAQTTTERAPSGVTTMASTKA